MKKQVKLQKSKLESDYQKTLEANKTRLEGELKKLKSQLTETTNNLKSRLRIHHELAESSNTEIVTLSTSLEVLKTNKSELKQAVDELTVSSKELEIKKINQQTMINDLTANIEKLHSDQNSLQTGVDGLYEELVKLKKDKKTLDEEFTSTKEGYEAQITALEAKLHSLEAQCNAQAQKIIEDDTNNDKIRENLANMQKALDERDRNLRIREEKVSQSESTIIRNSNLLNL